MEDFELLLNLSLILWKRPPMQASREGDHSKPGLEGFVWRRRRIAKLGELALSSQLALRSPST